MSERIVQEMDALNLDQTVHSSPSQNEADTCAIWDESRSMNSEESVLKERHNSLAITPILPEDVLSDIFEIASAMATGHSGRFNKKQLNSLLSISHVSSDWRRVAVGSPRLWANLSIFDSWPRSDCIDEIISRSSNFPLSIYASLSTQPPTEKLHNILNTNLGRIRSLAVIVAPASRLVYLLSGSTQPATVLKYLHLQAPYEPWNSSAAVMIPDELFQGSVPQLRTLILRNCHPSIQSSLLLPFLTEFTYQPMKRAAVPFLLQILHLLPKLQKLMLGNLDDHADQVSEDMLPVVHLPELHKLILVQSLSGAMITLLSHLTFPHDTSLEVNMPPTYHTTPAIISSFGHALTRHIGRSRYLKMEHDIICCGFTLEAWPEVKELDLVAPLISITISLSTEENEDQRRLIDFLRALFHSLEFEWLEVLEIHNVGLDSNDWSSIFGALPTLRTIQIDSGRIDTDGGFIDALSTSVNPVGDSIVLASTSTTRMNIPFSALQIVIALCWKSSRAELEECFSRRKAAGVPVRELRLINVTGITSSEAKHLHAAVDRVSWIEDGDME